jgi:hypothetical protein
MKLIHAKMTIQNAMRKLREIAHPITANHFLAPGAVSVPLELLMV